MGARSMKRAIGIVCVCVCASQRYRVTDLPERQRVHVQFVSVAWIRTYNARLSVCGGGREA